MHWINREAVPIKPEGVPANEILKDQAPAIALRRRLIRPVYLKTSIVEV